MPARALRGQIRGGVAPGSGEREGGAFKNGRRQAQGREVLLARQRSLGGPRRVKELAVGTVTG
jgi:hypothetical protein